MTPPRLLLTLSTLGDSIATDTFQVRAFDDNGSAAEYTREPSSTWLDPNDHLAAIDSNGHSCAPAEIHTTRSTANANNEM